MARNESARPARLNDAVDAVLLTMLEDDNFQKFLSPAYPEQSVHGDLFLDDAEMARMIIDRAREKNIPLIFNTKLKGVIRAMNVALRRYKFSRAQRREEAEVGFIADAADTSGGE